MNRSWKNIYRTGLMLIIVFAGIVANNYWTQTNKAENDFLKKQDLNITLKVIDIKPTGDHGYGVIYGQITSTNKPASYVAAFQDKYIFCKTEAGKILWVSDYYVMQKNDSVVVQSGIAKYRIYRKKMLISEYNLTITTDAFLYKYLRENKFLDFSFYKQ